jgi:cell division protein FtsB
MGGDLWLFTPPHKNKKKKKQKKEEILRMKGNKIVNISILIVIALHEIRLIFTSLKQCNQKN